MKKQYTFLLAMLLGLVGLSAKAADTITAEIVSGSGTVYVMDESETTTLGTVTNGPAVTITLPQYNTKVHFVPADGTTIEKVTDNFGSGAPYFVNHTTYWYGDVYGYDAIKITCSSSTPEPELEPYTLTLNNGNGTGTLKTTDDNGNFSVTVKTFSANESATLEFNPKQTYRFESTGDSKISGVTNADGKAVMIGNSTGQYPIMLYGTGWGTTYKLRLDINSQPESTEYTINYEAAAVVEKTVNFYVMEGSQNVSLWYTGDDYSSTETKLNVGDNKIAVKETGSYDIEAPNLTYVCISSMYGEQLPISTNSNNGYKFVSVNAADLAESYVIYALPTTAVTFNVSEGTNVAYQYTNPLMKLDNADLAVGTTTVEIPQGSANLYVTLKNAADAANTTCVNAAGTAYTADANGMIALPIAATTYTITTGTAEPEPTGYSVAFKVDGPEGLEIYEGSVANYDTVQKAAANTTTTLTLDADKTYVVYKEYTGSVTGNVLLNATADGTIVDLLYDENGNESYFEINTATEPAKEYVVTIGTPVVEPTTYSVQFKVDGPEGLEIYEGSVANYDTVQKAAKNATTTLTLDADKTYVVYKEYTGSVTGNMLLSATADGTPMELLYDENGNENYFTIDTATEPAKEYVVTIGVPTPAEKDVVFDVKGGNAELWTYVSGEGQKNFKDLPEGQTTFTFPYDDAYYVHAAEGYELVSVVGNDGTTVEIINGAAEISYEEGVTPADSYIVTVKSTATVDPDPAGDVWTLVTDYTTLNGNDKYIFVNADPINNKLYYVGAYNSTSKYYAITAITGDFTSSPATLDAKLIGSDVTTFSFPTNTSLSTTYFLKDNNDDKMVGWSRNNAMSVAAESAATNTSYRISVAKLVADGMTGAKITAAASTSGALGFNTSNSAALAFKSYAANTINNGPSKGYSYVAIYKKGGSSTPSKTDVNLTWVKDSPIEVEVGKTAQAPEVNVDVADAKQYVRYRVRTTQGDPACITVTETGEITGVKVGTAYVETYLEENDLYQTDYFPAVQVEVVPAALPDEGDSDFDWAARAAAAITEDGTVNIGNQTIEGTYANIYFGTKTDAEAAQLVREGDETKLVVNSTLYIELNSTIHNGKNSIASVEFTYADGNTVIFEPTAQTEGLAPKSYMNAEGTQWMLAEPKSETPQPAAAPMARAAEEENGPGATNVYVISFQPATADGSVALTSTKVTYKSDKNIATSIETIAPAAEAAEVIYFDLQGHRVANPTHGFYIRVEGNKATKVIL